ncbi:MAG: hypothetical protein RID53_08230 [Coleofasciculus sp. B1-GNL1-01]|uniref:hypothetical protein n=1 Tax=Coleofasciculus sp. B1-GNL1-01 TaxID=3068484 RepID=UPI0032F55DEE
MNQPDRTVVCALAAVTWLSLASCARNSTATKAPTAQSDNLSISTTNSPPSITREADSKTSIAQNTGNSRYSDQEIQLSQQTISIVTTVDIPGFNAPIFKPTYLPSGFYLMEFQATENYYINASNPFSYSIIYREREKNTCLELYDALDGTSFESLGLSEISVNVLQGEVTVYSGNVEDRPMIIARVKGEQVGLPSSYYFTLISGYSDWCEPVSIEEFIQVLQSMKPLN